MNVSNQVFSNLIWKFSERILAQGISFVVAMILARLLLPEEYGVVALILIFINIANSLVTMGFATSLVQKKDADEIDFSSVFWFSLFLSIVLYIIIYIGVVPLSEFYEMSDIIPIFRVLGIRIIVGAINSVQHSYVSRNLQFKKYFWSTLFGTIVSAVVGIYMAFAGYGAWALAVQYLTNTTIDTIVLFITVDWKPHFIFSMQRIKALFSFGWKILFDSIFGQIQTNLRSFIIGKVYTTADLAYYTNANKIPSLFLGNITQSITSVLLPVMSNNNDDDRVIVKFIKLSTQLSVYIMYPILVGVALVSYEFVLIVLTEKWAQLVPYLQLYCINTLCLSLMPPRNEALKAIGRSDIFLIENSVMRVIDIIILIIFVKSSPFILLLTYVFITILSTILIMYNAHKYNHYDFISQFTDMKNTIFASICMAISVIIISKLNFNIYIMFILKVVVGAIIYVGVSIIFKFEEFDRLLKLLNSYLQKIKYKVKTT